LGGRSIRLAGCEGGDIKWCAGINLKWKMDPEVVRQIAGHFLMKN